MTVHEFLVNSQQSTVNSQQSTVNSQQSTVNSQRLECGIIYFLEFPYVCDWKSSHHSSDRENICSEASSLIRCKMKKLGDRYNHLDTKPVQSPDNKERLSRL
ncbi:hypothetical protein [Nostoc sphaeroides]|uniref:Uncharacterized protein n=1 Tax=Nostoc sphaeroides CCNUC1 TaxID=2653204 RepID=A0A5P8VSH7_9NOSO|nr:hypothetical protein [Nostoc sphaeroides]QFS42869.1 hypothetical protein GXM_00342 [Nostoc sphaeroides CCNUC1]